MEYGTLMWFTYLFSKIVRFWHENSRKMKTSNVLDLARSNAKGWKLYFNVFLFIFPPVWRFTFPHPYPLFPFPPFFFSLSFISFQPVVSPLRMWPWKCTHSLLCCIVSHLHEDTRKLQKICADTVGHLTDSVFNRISIFNVQVTDRQSPNQVLTWVIGPNRTPIPHTKRCRLNYKLIFIYIKK